MTLFQSIPHLAQSGGQSNPFGMLLFVIPMIVIMYILMIKPQQKKQKEHQEMLKRLQVGDQIVTSGGIYARITAVKDKSYVVEIAKNTRIEITRSSVAMHLKDEDKKEETTG